MTIPKNERQAIKTKKCFPNKRVDDLLWRRARSIDNCLDEDKILEQEDDFKWNRTEIYEMFLFAFEEGYKKRADFEARKLLPKIINKLQGE